MLSGEVSGQALREQAGRLARNVKGVAEVENRIEVAQDLESRVTPALRRLHEAWLGFIRLLPVLLVALAIMAAAVLLGRWLARRQGLYRHLAANAFLAHLLAQVAQGIVLIGGAALAMLLLDASGLVNTLLGAAGILGLALGFALRDTVENYIASILLSLRRPFDAEDYVRIEKHEGFVVRLTSRATVLLTLDGNQVRIPNATVFKGLIVNFTAHPQRRFTFQVGIAPDEQLSRAQQVATDALAEVDGVLTDPPPAALYQDVPDVGVSLTVAGWMDQSTHDFLRVRSEAIRVVVTRMTEANVAAPEATIRVRRAQDGGTKRQEPKPATGTSAPEFPTSRDRSIERVVEQERSRGTDLLDSSKPPE
ncbi:MAG: mechanosensitive ion channel [Rhodospirillales bacterium]|nr:mechanosensitive ion channel [Rhodospirillales bacterium]